MTIRKRADRWRQDRRRPWSQQRRFFLIAAMLLLLLALLAASLITAQQQAESITIGPQPDPVEFKPDPATGDGMAPAGPTPDPGDSAPGPLQPPNSPDSDHDEPGSDGQVVPDDDDPPALPDPDENTGDEGDDGSQTPDPTATPTPVLPDPPIEDFPPDEPLPPLDLPGDPPPPVDLPDPPAAEPEPPAEPPAPPQPPEPLDLDILPPPAPPLPPPPEPAPPVELSPVAQGAADDLTGNTFGCAARCITRALLRPNVRDANLQLDVRTNVATTKSVWVLPSAPMIGQNGLPLHLSMVPRATQNSPSGEWVIDLSPLEHDTLYRIVLSVRDEQDNVEEVSTLVTTTSPTPDEVVAPGSPCMFECIVSGHIAPGADFGKAHIVVNANAPVSFTVALSPHEPISVNGTMYLEPAVTLTDVNQDPMSYEARAIGMAPETTYHLLVTATDTSGNTQQASATFTTQPAPPVPTPLPLPEEEPTNVFMWVDRLHVHDTGDLIGAGEIALQWGIRDYGEHEIHETWSLGPLKVLPGTTFEAGGSRIVEVHGNGWLPPVIFSASELDWNCTGGCIAPPHWCTDDPIQHDTDAGCLQRSNGEPAIAVNITAARLDSLRLSDLDDLPTCDYYGLEGIMGTARCAIVWAEAPTDHFVRFDALVGFWIHEDT